MTVERDISAFRAEAALRQRSALMVIGAVAIILTLVGWLLLRTAVFAKLKAFATAMDGISRRDLSISVPPTGQDEMMIMAKALTRLRDAVADALRLETMVETSPTAILLADGSGRLTYANRAARTLLGARAEVGQSADPLGLGDAFLLRLSDAASLPFSTIAAAGSETIELSVEAVRDGSGSITATMLSLETVTEREATRRAGATILSEVTDVAGVVASEARRLKELAETVSRQSAATLQQSRRAQDIVGSNADQAKAATTATTNLDESIGDIAKTSGAAARTAEQARTATERGTHAVRQLARSSEQIGDVVGLINEIAEQTRLLALNATIEAARAGDAGRGFAVVAGEVRNLAGQTAEATTRISSMIQGVRQEVAEASAAIGSLTGVVDAIVELQTKISQEIEDQRSASSAIASSVRKLAEGSAGISAIVGAVLSEANGTGESAQGLDAAAERLATEVAALNTQIGDFRTRLGAGG